MKIDGARVSRRRRHAKKCAAARGSRA
jgi:hypothetical protein